MTKSQYYITLITSVIVCLMVIWEIFLTQKMGNDQLQIREDTATIREGDQSFRLWQRVATDCFEASKVDVNMHNLVLKEGIQPPPNDQTPPIPSSTPPQKSPSPTPHH